MSIISSLSTKMNRRVFATIIGIAFCVTYLAGTIAMVGGLHETTSHIAMSFDQGPTMILTDPDLSRSYINGTLLPGNDTSFVAFSFANVTLVDNEDESRQLDNVFIVSVYDRENVLGLNMTDRTLGSNVWMGKELAGILENHGINAAENSSYTLSLGNRTSDVNVTAQYAEGSILPDDWLLVPRHTMGRLRPDLASNYSFLLILNSTIPLEEQPFMSEEIIVQPTSGVVQFFEKGNYQVEQGLWGIVVMSGAMTAVLVYCIISIETEFSAPTIKILRGIGANRAFVVRVFMFKALFITLVAGILGTAMGFCVASAVSSGASLFDVMSFILPKANFNSVILPILISLISGVVGGFWPAMKASKMFSPGRAAA